MTNMKNMLPASAQLYYVDRALIESFEPSPDVQSAAHILVSERHGKFELIHLVGYLLAKISLPVAPAVQATPSKDEIVKLWDLAILETTSGLDAMEYFSRALLSRYGAALLGGEDARPVTRNWEALAEQAREALEPFADIGAWLFARNLPDDTPVVEVRGLNGAAAPLTRGHFKAARSAAWAIRDPDEAPQPAAHAAPALPATPPLNLIEAICRACTSATWPDDFGPRAQALRREDAAEIYAAIVAELTPQGAIHG